MIEHSDPALRVALPLLGGSGTQEILVDPSATTVREGWHLFQSAGEVAGFAVADAHADLESAAQELYRRIFAVTSGLSLYRVWNYVPQINAVVDGLENYRRFCRGRSLAFEAEFGHKFQRQLPAASAVGAPVGPLAMAFVAGREPVRHVENPQQVPAFAYPPAYGPRPPSFARATVVGSESGRRIYISGTAAIRGHATVSATDLAGQLSCTRENLQLIAQAAGAGAGLGATQGWRRSFHAYIRHDQDFAAVQAFLQREMLGDDDTITYLHADLCRAELLVEIEAVLTAPGH